MIIQVIEAGLAATNGYLVADHENGVGCVIDAPQGVAAVMSQRAAALGVPLLILDPIPGQETRNADIVLEAGAAAENLLLQAVALDLGAVPVGAFDDVVVGRAARFQDARPLLLVPVGRSGPTRREDE